MDQTKSVKVYDLEERTFQFAKSTALFCKKLPKTITNREYAAQLIRASASVGANYIEANESLSKKDFVFRIKICRKEAKECEYWFRLINEVNGSEDHDMISAFMKEAEELKKIFSSIIVKST